MPIYLVDTESTVGRGPFETLEEAAAELEDEPAESWLIITIDEGGGIAVKPADELEEVTAD